MKPSPHPNPQLTVSKCKIVSPELGTVPGEGLREQDEYDSV